MVSGWGEDVSSADIALQLPPMAGQAWGGEQPSCAKHSWEGREQGTSKEVEMWDWRGAQVSGVLYLHPGVGFETYSQEG